MGHRPNFKDKIIKLLKEKKEGFDHLQEPERRAYAACVTDRQAAEM